MEKSISVRWNSIHRGGTWARWGLALLAALAAGESVYAQAGAPLPRCSADPAGPGQFYLMRYSEVTGGAPTTNLSLASVPATGAVGLTQIWNGATAPRVSPRDLSPVSGATVAGGMGKDGYIYAMRAVGTNEPGWDLLGGAWASEWRTHTRYYEMFRYGRDGVDNLGIVQDLGTYLTSTDVSGVAVPGALDLRLGPNFNAADIDPVTGIMYVAVFQNLSPTAVTFPRVYKIDVTQSPPRYVGTLQLLGNLPGAPGATVASQSGDFAIDATGTWAYGVATQQTGSTFGIPIYTSINYRFNLASGAVETLGAAYSGGPYGAGARLTNNADAMGFFGSTGFLATGTRVMTIPAGTLAPAQTTSGASSADAAVCLPKLVATLQCTPTSLVDAAGNVSQCTVTLDQPAPAGGLPIALVPPPGNVRYTTTCGASLTVAAGATTAQCSITAVPNTVPGDGFVDAPIALATPAATADYELGTPAAATVRIDDDDLAPVAVPALGMWGLLLMSLGLGALALRRQGQRGG
ncbi:MAG: hypothetical protein KA914_12815 [Ottowia sp.]|nr:hypothetical protein [Ottowia sp.]